MNTFQQAMDWLAGYEGGFVNHPKDPGGATMRGVTQRVYDAYMKSKGLYPRSVKHLTDKEHDAIYREQYWLPIKGDELPNGVAAALFDYGVNSGTSRAVKTLQRIVGASPDGVVGLHTLAKVNDYVKRYGQAQLIKKLSMERLAFVKRLKTWPTFGKGWQRRIVGVRDRAIWLAQQPHMTQPRPTDAAPGKALEANLSWLSGLLETLSAFFNRGETK